MLPRHEVVFGLTLVLALCAVPYGASAQEPLDYQKMADGARWGWLAEMADPLGCITQCGNKYGITLESHKENRNAYTIIISLDKKPVYSWQGHRYSVFRILGDRLYYADFSTAGSGGNTVAVDLLSGTKLWTSPLKALGAIEHSAYRNLLNLDAGYKTITIWGNESMGRYVEIKNAATGETVGHKICPKEPAIKPDAGEGK